MPTDVRRLGLARLLNPDEFDDPRSNPYADEPLDPPPDAPDAPEVSPEVSIDVGPPTIRSERPVAPPPEAPPPGRFGIGRMVPMVPGRGAAAEPAPARSPMVPASGGRSAAASAPPKGDSLLELLQAQRHDSLVRGANSVGDALYGAFTRTKAAPAQGSNMAGEMGARDALADKEAARAKAARLEQAAAIDADPSSEASRATQALIKELVPNFLPDEVLAKLSRTELNKLGPIIKEIEAKRADRVFQDEQRRKGEGFRAGESKLDRDLKREELTSRERLEGDKAGAKKLADGLKLTEDLRKEFNNLPEVKAFKEVEVSFDKIKRSAAIAKSSDSAAADMAMIFGFMKMQDPGSTVREGEYANAQNAGGVPERVIALYNRARAGQLLTGPMRDDFLRNAESLYAAHRQQVAPVIERYRSLGEKAGVPPDDVAVGGRVRVTNGSETLEIDPADLKDAEAEGFKRAP